MLIRRCHSSSVVCSTLVSQRHARVVHQNVEPLVALDHELHDVFPPCFVGDVLHDEDRITATTADLFDDERSLFGIEIGHCNGGAFFGELESASTSNPTAPPGHVPCLPAHSVHSCVFSRPKIERPRSVVSHLRGGSASAGGCRVRFVFPCFTHTVSSRQPCPRRTADSGVPVIPELRLCPATSQFGRRLRTSIALSSAGVPGENSVHIIPSCERESNIAFAGAVRCRRIPEFRSVSPRTGARHAGAGTRRKCRRRCCENTGKPHATSGIPFSLSNRRIGRD